MKSWATTAEIWVSCVQMAVLLGIVLFLLLRMRRFANEAAAGFLAGALLCLALGDLFSETYMILHGGWPPYFSAADVAWIGFFYLLVAANRQLVPLRGHRHSPLGWVLAAAVVAVLIPYTVWYGRAAANLLYGVGLTAFALAVSDGLCLPRGEADRLRPFFAAQTAFLLLELALLLTKGIGFAVVDVLYTAALLAVDGTFYRGTGKR